MELVILLFIGLVPFWYGLFYSYTVFFISAIFIGAILYIFQKNKHLCFKKNTNFYIYASIVFSYLVTCFWAVDKELGFEGFLRHFSSLIVFIILMQLGKENKKKILETIPYSGALMVIASLLLALIPSIRDSFFTDNGRLIGFFQYSNSFALFLLIGIAILMNKNNKTKKDIAAVITLGIGIFLTGSRFTFIIAILYAIFCIFKYLKNKKSVKFAIITIAIALIAIFILFLFAHDYLRIFRISLNESTLIGRTIYNLDGLNLLMKYPFGLGYMGYSYAYPEVQTADYTIKFVHNDLLQQGLDTGIIPMVALLFLWIYNIFSKKTEKVQKQIFIIMFAHLLFDFNMQFAIFEYIFVLLLEQKNGEAIYFKNKNSITCIIAGIATILLFGYFGLGELTYQIENYDLSLELLPDKTSSLTQKMVQEENITEAAKIADNILKKNKYIAIAYKVKADYSLDKAKWQDMCENQKKLISLRKYDIVQYENFVFMISQGLDKTIKGGSRKDTNYLINELSAVQSLLEQTKGSTSELAYNIVDKPKLELREEVVKYITEVTTEK